MRLLNIFKKDKFKSSGLKVTHAFRVGGKDFYEVDNIFNLPYERGKKAVQFYEELRMKCDYEYLKAFCEAGRNIFTNSKKLGFNEMQQIKTLFDQLHERLYNIVDTDIIYKLASVVFFGEDESPIDYDWDTALKNINHWKKHKTVTAFFLTEPMQRLVPFLQSADINFQSYSETIKEFNKIQWEKVFSLLLPNQRKDFSDSYAYYVGETQSK